MKASPKRENHAFTTYVFQFLMLVKIQGKAKVSPKAIFPPAGLYSQDTASHPNVSNTLSDIA